MATEPVLRVRDSSSASELAQDLARLLSGHPTAHLEALGPHATYKAVQAVVLCRSLVERPGRVLRMVPSFVPWTVTEEVRAAVRVTVCSARW